MIVTRSPTTSFEAPQVNWPAVPETANTVIMQEKVTVKENHLLINNSVSENKNIRPLGEQIKKGTLALKK